MHEEPVFRGSSSPQKARNPHCWWVSLSRPKQGQFRCPPTAPYSYRFSPSAGTALPTMASADYSRQALLRVPVGRTSVSPPQVRTCSFPPCACCIYTSDSVTLGASSCFADLPILVCLMQFLFVRPVVCLQLPSDSVSRRTPLSLAMRLVLYLLRSGLSPVRTRSCRAHPKKYRPGEKTRGAVFLTEPDGRPKAPEPDQARSDQAALIGIFLPVLGVGRTLS